MPHSANESLNHVAAPVQIPFSGMDRCFRRSRIRPRFFEDVAC